MGSALPGLMSASGPEITPISNIQPNGCDDIALFTISIVQQRDTRSTIRIVLNVRHLCRHTRLFAPEINDPVFLLVPAGPIPDRDLAAVVPAAALAELYYQRFFRRAPRYFLERR